MKTTSLFKAVALVAIMVASVLNSEVKAQDGFITNQVMNGELVASKRCSTSIAFMNWRSTGTQDW